jgi:hypothetical protein
MLPWKYLHLNMSCAGGGLLPGDERLYLGENWMLLDQAALSENFWLPPNNFEQIGVQACTALYDNITKKLKPLTILRRGSNMEFS